jgi:hypothetical protein
MLMKFDAYVDAPRSPGSQVHSPMDPQGAGPWGARVEPRQLTEKLVHGRPSPCLSRRLLTPRASSDQRPRVLRGTPSRQSHVGRRRLPISIEQTRCRGQFAIHLRLEIAIACAGWRSSRPPSSWRLRRRSWFSSTVDTVGRRSVAPSGYLGRVRDSASGDVSMSNLPRERAASGATAQAAWNAALASR